MPDPGAVLAERARELLPAGCFTASAQPDRNWPLLPGEVSGAMVQHRAAEFSAGRHAARMAMVMAGLEASAVPKGPDRAPVWPGGLAGSISHSDLACVAAVSAQLRGIGLDLEPLRPFDPGVAALVSGPEDLVDRGQGQSGIAVDPGLLIFCAKESAYKAQYPLSQRLFGPEVLAVHIQGEAFRAVFRETIEPFAAGAGIEGRITLCAGHVLAVAWISG